ncbi:hypothetical protein CKN63_13265 [Carnobacterium divergens]|uniref:hypothetical protein n=1 Tax=Carnobacterium divergens TaxID=2748 RepID=UPI0010724E56|nr:hypothetical protein [Carnobacterium divergens]TFI60530.1 hypothetical protein CKN59_13200 [Carnobacterium divergens]TFI61670.1 hypothetical protein CKN76_12785 [Carnobacterium divergens]TFJ01005.1 hypothetical protein CKN75_12790 [Carnobacterium divergens]TFJ08925.1 hypothetical protein CKN71_12805 [Carnobacterium divergens]TFJ15634.1 hypothetical protein CKN63_13265 [Carnobacterium divergens]
MEQKKKKIDEEVYRLGDIVRFKYEGDWTKGLLVSFIPNGMKITPLVNTSVRKKINSYVTGYKNIQKIY